jgi:hypothetical protein
MVWNSVKLVLALIYLLFDELGGFVRWLKERLPLLAWYFAAVQKLADTLEANGLQSPNAAVRRLTPYLTLPFLLLPVSIILPAKVLVLGAILHAQALAIPAFIILKFFGAVFVKQTWTILRPVGRRSNLIASIDDRWLALEQWARRTVRDFANAVRQTEAYQAILALVRSLRAAFTR